jgi:hypothetical protein
MEWILMQVQFAVEQVDVTALHYSPHVTSLAVGYNLGTWSLISLRSLEVMLTVVECTVTPVYASNISNFLQYRVIKI